MHEINANINASASAIGDRIALRGLVDQYALAVDARDGEQFARLFTADGVLQGFELDGAEPIMRYAGYAELRNVIGERASRFMRTFHVIANHTCELDGDEAAGVAYCMAHHLSEPDGILVDTVMLIRYHDRYRRVDSTWRISQRDAIRHWSTTANAQR